MYAKSAVEKAKALADNSETEYKIKLKQYEDALLNTARNAS